MGRILIVANDFPYPMNNGAAIDMWGQVRTLKKLGFTTDLVVTIKTMPPAEDIRMVKAEVDRLLIVERQKGLRAAVGIAPFQVLSRNGLATVPLSGEYAAVILMAEHVASILQNPSLRAKKCILRLHNDEERFFQELSKSSKSLFHKAFYQSEAVKFKRLTPKLMAKSDALWFISGLEKSDHVKHHPGDAGKSFFVPPLVELRSMRSQPLEGHKVLFLATLALANNASAVEWYVANVHPCLSNIEDYGFVVAGNTRGSSVQALIKIVRSHPNIVLHENPKDTQELYKGAAVFVNPVFRGAGLKLKTIDAIQAGLPVVTTSIGIEGTGLVHGKHLLVADTPSDFARSIRDVLSCKDMARALVASAQDFVKTEFDQPRIINRALASIL